MAAYVELHCHSYFSLLDGASSPDALVKRASDLGMRALALTDHNAVYGALPFNQAAKKQGVRPILGAELTLDNSAHLTLLVENKTGWHNLCWLISRARHNAPKGKATLPRADLVGRTEGLIALSGCRNGEVAAAILHKDKAKAEEAAHFYRALFGPGHFWIELQHHLLPHDNALIKQLIELAHHLQLGYVATNNVHYTTRTDSRLQDVLVCSREGYLRAGWKTAPSQF